MGSSTSSNNFGQNPFRSTGSNSADTANSVFTGGISNGLQMLGGELGKGPTADTRSSLDPALQAILAQATAKLSGMFNNPIPSVGPRQILGESPEESMFRNLGISNLSGAIPSAGSFTPNESAASSFLGKTINGNFLDPTQSPVYQSIADSILRKANQSSMLAGDQLNANFAGSGHFGGSGPLLQARNDLAVRTGQGVSDTLASYLMPLYQQQLGYQQNALPLSMQFGDAQRNLPLNQLNLSNQAYNLAGIPRGIQQSQLDELFNSAQRNRSAQIEPFTLLSSLLGGTPPANTVITPSEFERIWLPLIAGGAKGISSGIGAMAAA